MNTFFFLFLFFFVTFPMHYHVTSCLFFYVPDRFFKILETDDVMLVDFFLEKKCYCVYTLNRECSLNIGHSHCILLVLVFSHSCYICNSLKHRYKTFVFFVFVKFISQAILNPFSYKWFTTCNHYFSVLITKTKYLIWNICIL